jgi:CRISPR-associated protein Csm3
MSEIRELGRVRLSGLIRLRSGLHIGASKDSVEIGGIDNPVIKHPFTGEPYIPGSSLKGKLRFLLEWAFGTIRQDGMPGDTTINNRWMRRTPCCASSAMR